MFDWLGNLFPYSDLHSLNLDWILNKMKETAAQAAKAVADAANALAQVAEAKAAALTAQTAAQDAQTAARDAQTAANTAAVNAASATADATAALNSANSARTAAENAQNTANAAQTAAENAQNTANEANTAAENAQNTANAAQTAAQNAQNTADSVNGKFPIRTSDISNSAVTDEKIANNISGSKLIKRSINGERIAFSSINAGFESYASSIDASVTAISANEISFLFSISGSGSFVNNTAAFIRLVKPSTTLGTGKIYLKTSPFPANRSGNNATFDCERRLIIGEIFDNNDNELGICMIKASTIYETRDDGSKGWTGKLRLLYCTTEVDFTEMADQIGVNTVRLTNLY